MLPCGAGPRPSVGGGGETGRHTRRVSPERVDPGTEVPRTLHPGTTLSSRWRDVGGLKVCMCGVPVERVRLV